VNAVVTALPTTGHVERVFAGRLGFDDPSVSGNIEQFCQQPADAQGVAETYGGPSSIVPTSFALRNNLDAFGIALQIDRTSLFPKPGGGPLGLVAWYVIGSQKDCNGNGRDDADDIACGKGNVCGGIAGSGDCNGNGIPDDCEVAAPGGN